ncbi:WXG100 family type VII secretion target [Amycolatopsis sp. FDAARGOS 1241]|uniref:WXG100 family type VII secretion target n=1 Tax=Amycolatopsis sp. FDAARGOS 1241 TaxID=2778070 RepID=UPI001EF32E8A|nr:WXG100 family type VII secretion target [Amycolatopsis sp. FDAARGOS 1241]
MNSIPPRVVPDGMRDVAGEFARAIDSANAHLRQVNNEMAALQASWRGDASVRFGQAMNEWEQQYDLILGRLADLLAVTGGADGERRVPCPGGA